jgi:hypothetical protein
MKKLFYVILCLIFVVAGIQWGTGNTAVPAVVAAPSASYIVNPFLTPDWIGESDIGTALFGASVATAGDVNGDGYDDIVVGAPSYSNIQNMEGRAYVFHGSAAGVKPLPAWVYESNVAECELGQSVASAGDVNNDGYDDVLVASEFCGVVDREGRAYLFLGSATGLAPSYAWMIQGAGSTESLGWSIASAGDVNGDGYADVIVGAPWASYPEGNEGRAYVFYGSASGLPATANWTKESNVAWSGFGTSVASAGDVNNDGFSDVIIGQTHIGNPQLEEGRVYVYLGSAGGLEELPVWTYENNVAGSWLGESVASAGDVNNDGYDDVIVGGYRYSNPQALEGIAYLFLSSAAGLAETPAWSAEGNQENAQYGQSVASAGDVNQDGYDDVLVGAPQFSNGEIREGRIFLYYGSSTGLLSAPVFMTESNQEIAQMGYSVASAGDVNDDNIDDIIAGISWFDGGQGNEGRAIVYHGGTDLTRQLWLAFTQR